MVSKTLETHPATLREKCLQMETLWECDLSTKKWGHAETTLSDGQRFERLLGDLWQDNAEKAVASIAEKGHSKVCDREL